VAYLQPERTHTFILAQRASVGSTEASENLPARFGVVGPTRARGKKSDSLGRTTPAVSYPYVPSQNSTWYLRVIFLRISAVKVDGVEGPSCRVWC
jgi:hypothetical protein